MYVRVSLESPGEPQRDRGGRPVALDRVREAELRIGAEGPESVRPRRHSSARNSRALGTRFALCRERPSPEKRRLHASARAETTDRLPL